jgi:LPS sulfotransferase NodH
VTPFESIRRSARWAREVAALREPRVQRLALEWGLLRGRREYTRFILLGRSRTGSNFLRGLLTANPSVTLYGEVFKNPDSIEWGTPGQPDSGKALARYRSAPARFLEEYVYRPMPRDTRAVGFKLFYYHARSGSLTAIWEHLREAQEVRVIHIKRANILSTHLSRARAERSRRWVNLDGHREDEAPIRIDPEACREDFERTRGWEEECGAFFAGHPLIDVLYERLAEEPSEEARRVQQFLGLPVEAVAPQTHKQTRVPMAAAIENYGELKAFFRGTEWESFFEE